MIREIVYLLVILSCERCLASEDAPNKSRYVFSALMGSEEKVCSEYIKYLNIQQYRKDPMCERIQIGGSSFTSLEERPFFEDEIKSNIADFMIGSIYKSHDHHDNNNRVRSIFYDDVDSYIKKDKVRADVVDIDDVFQEQGDKYGLVVFKKGECHWRDTLVGNYMSNPFLYDLGSEKIDLLKTRQYFSETKAENISVFSHAGGVFLDSYKVESEANGDLLEVWKLEHQKPVLVCKISVNI